MLCRCRYLTLHVLKGLSHTAYCVLSCETWPETVNWPAEQHTKLGTALVWGVALRRDSCPPEFLGGEHVTVAQLWH